MKNLIIGLAYTIKFLYSFVVYLLILYIKNPTVPKANRLVNKPYKKVDIDDKLPIVENAKFYDYKVLLKEYKLIHDKPLNPIG